MTPTLSVSLPSFGRAPDGRWRSIIDLARHAEEAGVDRLVVSDHIVLGPHVDRYPWGTFPTGPDGDWLEPFTVLSAIAAATSSVRLATSILIAPLRPATVLAKTAATLDQLSAGRLDLGVGVGWQREEYDATGVDFNERGRLLTDAIATCRALWEGRVPDVYCEPRPLQARLPVWFSGTLHDRNVRRIVELGDGWIPVGGPPVEEIGAGIQRLRAAFAGAGRDPDELQVQAGARSLEAVPDLARAGVTTITLFLRLGYGSAAGTRDALAELVERFASAIGR